MAIFVVRLADLEFLSPHNFSGGLSPAGINVQEPFFTALELFNEEGGAA